MKRAALLLPLALAACASGPRRPPPGADPGPPYFWEAREILRRRPIPPDEPALVTTLQRAPRLSVHLIQVNEGVPRHFHARSDETVYVLRGRGVFELGEETREVSEGSVIHIPQGTPHAYRSESAVPTAVLSVFTPPFEEGDRVPVPKYREP